MKSLKSEIVILCVKKKEEQVPLDQDMLEQFFKTFLRSRFQVQVCVT